LRRCRGSDTHANAFSEPNSDRDGDCNSHSNAYSYTDGHGECNSNADGYAHGYSETYTNPEDRSHAKIPAHARTSPVGPIGMTRPRRGTSNRVISP
jgi:hypothetical protein